MDPKRDPLSVTTAISIDSPPNASADEDSEDFSLTAPPLAPQSPTASSSYPLATPLSLRSPKDSPLRSSPSANEPPSIMANQNQMTLIRCLSDSTCCVSKVPHSPIRLLHAHLCSFDVSPLRHLLSHHLTASLTSFTEISTHLCSL